MKKGFFKSISFILILILLFQPVFTGISAGASGVKPGVKDEVKEEVLMTTDVDDNYHGVNTYDNTGEELISQQPLWIYRRDP